VSNFINKKKGSEFQDRFDSQGYMEIFNELYLLSEEELGVYTKTITLPTELVGVDSGVIPDKMDYEIFFNICKDVRTSLPTKLVTKFLDTKSISKSCKDAISSQGYLWAILVSKEEHFVPGPEDEDGISNSVKAHSCI